MILIKRDSVAATTFIVIFSATGTTAIISFFVFGEPLTPIVTTVRLSSMLQPACIWLPVVAHTAKPLITRRFGNNYLPHQ